LWKIPSEESALKQKYHVEEFPQILLLDPRGKEFARFGLISMDAVEYADKIVETIEGFEKICSSLSVKWDVFEEGYWIDLYRKAKQLSIPYFAKAILERGCKKERGTFFNLEKFEKCLKSCKLGDSKVLKMKIDLLKKDPDNKWGTHFKVA